MAIASEIIKRAFRESNLIPVGSNPTTAQQTEALDLLNGIIVSTVGNEVSQGLNELTIGGDFDQSGEMGDYIPYNTRLVVTLDDNYAIGLHPKPVDGQRFAVVDATDSFAYYSLNIDANGRKIEGATDVTLDTGGINRQWLYRADTANWVKIADLELADLLPLPSEFDDYFVTMLALRINPRYSQVISQETMNALSRMRSQIRARYCQTVEIAPDLKPWGLAAERFVFSSDDFDTGAAV